MPWTYSSPIHVWPFRRPEYNNVSAARVAHIVVLTENVSTMYYVCGQMSSGHLMLLTVLIEQPD